MVRSMADSIQPGIAPIPRVVRWIFSPLLLAFGGVALAAAFGYLPLAPSQAPIPTWFIGSIGLAFTSFGLFLVLDGIAALERLRGWLGLVFLVAFAAPFNWIAFGPGERHFRTSSSLGFGATAIGETATGSEIGGRIAFGVFAVLLDLLLAAPLLVVAWRWLHARRADGD